MCSYQGKNIGNIIPHFNQKINTFPFLIIFSEYAEKDIKFMSNYKKIKIVKIFLKKVLTNPILSVIIYYVV